MRECVFLVADTNMHTVFSSFMGRDRFFDSLGCAPFDFDPAQDLKKASGQNDPGLYTRAHQLLDPMRSTHRRAVVVLDHAWEGSPGAANITAHIERNLQARWDEYAVIVIDPELENWIWVTTSQRQGELSVHSRVVESLRYPGEQPLRDWLRDKGLWPDGAEKPNDPKKAVEDTLRLTKTRRSGAIYGRIVERVSPRTCNDPAFHKLRKTLRDWFGEA